MSRFQHIDDVWEFLNNIPMFGVTGTKAANFDLGNIRSFCEKMGNPQDQFKSIHIAGTNGKGTTAGLLESVYLSAGYKTGMFTSPHLQVYNERVRIGGQNISDERILDFFQEAEPWIDSIPLTYFEWSTVLAFWTFAKEKVDVGIVEVGLGGRLDSTNIITPEISVITSIGLDHEGIIGNSLAAIAREKAGIIKKSKPVVVGKLDAVAFFEVQKIAENHNAKIFLAEDLNPEYDDGIITINEIGKFRTNLIEPINRWNVAMVYQVVSQLQNQFPVSQNEIKSGFEAFKGLSGRFEKLSEKLDWYFSGAHNHQAIHAMKEGMKSHNLTSDVLILSMMADKVKPEILDEFSDFKSIYFFEQSGERAAKIGDITSELEAQPITEKTFFPILNELRSRLVIFAGSFYFYGTVKRWLSQID